MIFGIEKKKLEKLSTRMAVLSESDQGNVDQLNEIYKEYIQIIKKLHAKEPNIFANIHKYGLAELKAHKDINQKTPGQQNFDNFKEAIESFLEDTLVYMKDYLHT